MEPPPHIKQKLDATWNEFAEGNIPQQAAQPTEPKPNSLIEFFQWLLSGPGIQLAMLDTVGDTRGTTSSPVTIIQQTWKQTDLCGILDLREPIATETVSKSVMLPRDVRALGNVFLHLGRVL